MSMLCCESERELGQRRLFRGSKLTHHEESMVGSGSNDSDFDPVFRVPSCESIKDVDVFSCIQIIDSSFSVDLKGVLATLKLSAWSRIRTCSGRLTPS